MRKFECDGCSRVISLPDHQDPDMVCGCKNFWGWMEVGGLAWQRFHDKGIHPMETFLETLAPVLNKLKEH